MTKRKIPSQFISDNFSGQNKDISSKYTLFSVKKSQIFLLDAFLAFIIVVVAIAVILSYTSSTTSNMNVYAVNQQVLNSLTKTKINSLNDEEIRELFKAGYIKNVENTVGQQIGEFYFLNNLSLAQNLTRVFIKDFITKQMNANISLIENDSGTITNTELHSILNRQTVSIDDAVITSVTKRSIIGFINETTFYGPYTLEIKIWQ